MKKNNTSLYLVAILAVALLIGVGYAALAATLTINGQTTIKKASWDVHFQNVTINSGNYTIATENNYSHPYTVAGNSALATNMIASNPDVAPQTIYYKTTLTAPGQSNSFTIEVVNRGTIDAKIGTVTLPTLDTTSARLMTATCTWEDGTTIQANDTINANQTKKVKCTNTFKTSAELTESDLALFTSSAVTAATSLQMNFVQAD